MPSSATRHAAALASLLIALMFGGEVLLAQTVDPHEVYERRCAGCHEPHAVDFVQGGLEHTNGEIVGTKSGKELGTFLAGGHGRLAGEEIEPMVVHLTSILESGGLFRAKCFICHGRGVALARRKLLLRNGRLIGRYTGRDIASFMADHGRLEESEIPTILRMLERQLATPTAR